MVGLATTLSRDGFPIRASFPEFSGENQDLEKAKAPFPQSKLEENCGNHRKTTNPNHYNRLATPRVLRTIINFSVCCARSQQFSQKHWVHGQGALFFAPFGRFSLAKNLRKTRINAKKSCPMARAATALKTSDWREQSQNILHELETKKVAALRFEMNIWSHYFKAALQSKITARIGVASLVLNTKIKISN